MVFNATTAPTIARASGSGGLATAVNAGLTSGVYRFATNGTQTTLPASIAPGSTPPPVSPAEGADAESR
ncbi:hypothetical protein SVIOM74S_05801 [Streptomyces violarus]